MLHSSRFTDISIISKSEAEAFNTAVYMYCISMLGVGILCPNNLIQKT